MERCSEQVYGMEGFLQVENGQDEKAISKSKERIIPGKGAFFRGRVDRSDEAARPARLLEGAETAARPGSRPSSASRALAPPAPFWSCSFLFNRV